MTYRPRESTHFLVGPLSFVFLALLLASCIPAHADQSRAFLRPARAHPSPLDELTADGRPTPAAIAVLRSHVRGRVARVWVGDTHFDVRHVRFDSLGIAFAAEPRMGERSGNPSATSHDSTGPRSGLSPISWGAVQGLETRHSYVLPGIVTGTLLMTIAGGAVASAAGSDPGPGIIIVYAFPPAGALLGGLVGAAFPRWQHEWPPATRPPGTTR